MAKINLYDLKKLVDSMVNKHSAGINSMSDRIIIIEDKGGLEFQQICEYPECYPDVSHIDNV